MFVKPWPLMVSLLLIAGCSSLPLTPKPQDSDSYAEVLVVSMEPKQGGYPLFRNSRPLSLSMDALTDERAMPAHRKIGDIKATVFDIHRNQLAVNQDPTTLVLQAVRGQMEVDGFRLVTPNEPSDFRITHALKSFTLEIAGRDERRLMVETTLRDGRDGQVVWSGIVTEYNERFAGVSGNSRSSITEYLNEGMDAFARKYTDAIRDALLRAYPNTITAAQPQNLSTIPGVKTVQAPMVRDKLPAASPSAPPVSAVSAAGFVSVQSIPSRARVYVDDVYHGMTPIRIEVPVGVTILTVKLDGHQSITEKVAVRRNDTTPLELKLRR